VEINKSTSLGFKQTEGMPRRGVLDCMLTWTVLGITVFFETPIAQGQSFSNPTRLGETAATTVDSQDIFDPSPPCDVKVTLLGIARAEEAWNLIREASASNKPPRPGFEYILARVRFDYYAREGSQPDKAYEVREDELIAASADGKWYEIPAIVTPKPRLKTKLQSGESSEGWTVFLVPHGDKKPLMFFQRGGIWFQLYKEMAR
jgi:hypothetical protein